MLNKLILATATLLITNLAQAQMPGTSIAAGYVGMNDAAMRDGGEASVNTLQFSFSHIQALSAASTLGLQLRADKEDWSFDGNNRFGAAPWSDVHRYSIAIPFSHALNNDWRMSLTPTFEWAGEQDADAGDSLNVGLMAGGFKTFGKGRTIGGGLAVFHTLDDKNRVFPFIIVDWRINDSWRVFNPLGLGVSGPAGVELAYRMSESVELGLGGSWRTSSFRLAQDNATAPGGIGEFSYVPVFLHMTWKATPGLTLNAYAAMALSGRVIQKDSGGDDLLKEELDNTPAIGLNASFRF